MGQKKNESKVTGHKKDPHSLKTTDRRRSGVGDNVPYKVKGGGSGGNRFSDFFSTANYSSGPSSGTKAKKK